MPANIKRILDRWSTLKDRGRLEQHWQDLAEVFMPNGADFEAGFSEGDRRNDDLYDSSPEQARKMLASSIDGLIKPKTSKWFDVEASDKELNDNHEAKVWMDEVGERMYSAIYARKARFMQRSGETDNSLVTFGTGSLFTGVNRNKNGLSFKTSHMRDTFIAENSDGVVDTHYLRMRLTPRQAAQLWGEDNLGHRLKEILNDRTARDKKQKFLWAVEPREDLIADNRRSTNLPFSSVVLDIEGEHIIKESGFKTFPFAVPRWETTVLSAYGRSPAMVALPDALTLQQQGKTLLVAGQKAVDPPMWMLDDAVIGTPRTYPAGVTYIDGEAVRDFGGRPPLGSLDFNKNIPLGREMQQDTRDMIWRAFFRNVLQLPIDGPAMTATEVIERKEEFIRTIGPVFGQLESDYIGHVVERTFEILQDEGQLPEPPDFMVNRELRFEFRSPIQDARRQAEAFGMVRAREVLDPFMEGNPEMIDHWDTDKMARDIPDIFGAPADWLRDEEVVQSRREERAEKAEQEELLQSGEAFAQIVNQAGAAAQAGAPQ